MTPAREITAKVLAEKFEEVTRGAILDDPEISGMVHALADLSLMSGESNFISSKVEAAGSNQQRLLSAQNNHLLDSASNETIQAAQRAGKILSEQLDVEILKIAAVAMNTPGAIR